MQSTHRCYPLLAALTVPRAALAALPALAAALAFLATAAAGSAQIPPQSAAEPPPIEAMLPAAPGEYDLAVDIRHYDIELALGGPEILGRVTITVRPNGATSLPLDFTGLGISGVRVGDEPATFDYTGGKLTVALPEDGRGEAVRGGADTEAAGRRQPGDADLHITIDYHGTPDDGLIIRDNVHGNPTAFVDNWPNRARFWLPSIDHPADKATASFTVHAPSAWQVIANGAPAGDPSPSAADALGGASGKITWRWATEVLHPTYTLVVGAADFAIESLGRAACGNAPASPDPDGCVDVSFWVYPEDAEFAREVFDRAPEMVDFFTETIGPYPFEKLANVQSATRFGGMENSSAIFYSERAIAAGGLGEGTVSHEIAHQWFGDSATESDWSHLWLSEGFATYFGDLFFEAADGVEDFRRRMEQSRQGYVRSNVAGRPIVDPEGPRSLLQLLNGNNYSKGGWVLHMLRGVLGDEIFFRGIRAYYAEFAFGNAFTDDLRRVFEEVSGESLEWFFDQWVHQPGYPVLASEWEMAANGTDLVLTVTQTQSAEWPAFRLPMEVEIRSLGGAARQRIEITERSQSFTIPVAGPATLVTLDPDGWVLKGS